jgi:hypothetical protein
VFIDHHPFPSIFGIAPEHDLIRSQPDLDILCAVAVGALKLDKAFLLIGVGMD